MDVQKVVEHASAFAQRALDALGDAAYALYVQVGSSAERDTIYIVRDDVDGNEHVDEFGVAKAIAKDYARLHPEHARVVKFVGTYCK